MFGNNDVKLKLGRFQRKLRSEGALKHDRYSIRTLPRISLVENLEKMLHSGSVEFWRRGLLQCNLMFFFLLRARVFVYGRCFMRHSHGNLSTALRFCFDDLDILCLLCLVINLLSLESYSPKSQVTPLYYSYVGILFISLFHAL